MKYLKSFQKEADYQTFVESDKFVTPNVSFAKEENLVFYHPYEDPSMPNNVIMYTASEKLPECDELLESGFRLNAFNTTLVSHEFANGVGTFTFEEDVTSIGYHAFRNCSGLTSIVIPDSVTSIGDYAFYHCSGLTGELVIPDSVTSIGGQAFDGCSGLTGELVIPDSVTSIGIGVFSNCSGLTSISIPDSVTIIGAGAFDGCTSLPVEGNLRYADTYLVEVTDKNQTSYTIKEGTKWIDDHVFNSCKNLTSIVIPDSVTSIGNDAFRSCSSLSSITCYATTAPTIGKDTFNAVKSNGMLYYPSGSDYSSWMKTSSYYLGKYNWTGQEITD